MNSFLSILMFFFACTLHAAPQQALKVSANKQGLYGATNAAGKVVIPFIYFQISKLEGDNAYWQVSLKKTDTLDTYFNGVLNTDGKIIVPVKYAYLNFESDIKQFKVQEINNKNQIQTGYLDANGKVIVPVIYEELERISNMGSEPTMVAKLKGKYGYLNKITGKILIAPQYDALVVEGLNTNAEGLGYAQALKDKKWGIITTENKIIVPFEYDSIDDYSVSDGSARGSGGLAEWRGKLVNLSFKDGKFVGNTEVRAEYSHRFVFRDPTKITEAFDGMYVSEQYPNMGAAWKAYQQNRLRWAAIPSFEIAGNKAYVSFGIFKESALPLLPNELGVIRQKNGFSLMDEVKDEKTKKMVAKKVLSFVQKDGLLVCQECSENQVPVDWRLTKIEPPAPFGGIGVAINKNKGGPVLLAGVLKGGPAEKAGLKKDDVIVKVNSLETSEMTETQASESLRGAAGSKVKLLIERGGKRLPEMTLERAVITIK